MTISAVDLEREFRARFGATPRLFSAPGRVNLIGEHTDYNDGFVLPMAIERRTFVAGRARADRRVRVCSLNTADEHEFDLDHPGGGGRGSWIDYVEGTAQALRERSQTLSGAELLLSSDVPIGAGLSSSAALEVSVGYALLRLSGQSEPDRVGLALAGQAAEHRYVGALVGIMDQYVAALAQADSALLIDCRSLDTESVPLALGDAGILICDTRIKHDLASSAYNERRQQCAEGVALLARRLPGIRALRDVSSSEFEAHAAALPEVVRRRCQHVISENERTLSAVEALRAGRLADFGALMSASHESLRTDYEVSSPELDEAVAVTRGEPGVYGARMTGGGFGGCTITLVERARMADVSGAIRRRFVDRFGIEPQLFSSRACAGAREEASTARA